MSNLKLFWLGPPRVELEGQAIDLNRRKALALLVYLAASDKPHSRDALATLFYPDNDQSRARAYLRRDLAVLNTTLAGNWLDADRDVVRLKSGYWLDMRQFRDRLAACETHDHSPDVSCAHCLELLAEAVALYTDDFLAGFTLRDCPEFDDWQFFQAESLRQELGAALERLAWGCIQAAQPEAAIAPARRWVALDPLHEPAQRALIRAYGETGQVSAALRQFEEYAALLEEELGLPPEEQTVTLVEAIKARRLLGPFLTQLEPPAAPPPTLPPPAPPSAPVAPPSGGNEAPPFVARQPEMARLAGWLTEALAGRHRVVFITGDAGQGKTALLHALTRRALTDHPGLVAAGGNCNAYTGRGDPYLPFREILERFTGDIETGSMAGTISQTQAARLQQLAPAAMQAIATTGPALINTFLAPQPLVQRAARLAQPQAGWLRHLQTLAASRQAEENAAEQSDLFEQYARLIQALASRQPLLLLLDDLQWVDGGSTGLLFHLSRRLVGYPVLIVGAYRPADVAPGRAGERHPLERLLHEFQRQFGDNSIDLSRAEGRPFIDAWLDSEPNHLDESFRAMLHQQTGGHPLFTLELLRGMRQRSEISRDEAGFWVAQPNLNWQALPARVEGAIGERIDRLPPPLKELLQVASVVGEEFSLEIVAQILNASPREVLRQLSSELSREHQLVQSLGVKQEGTLRLAQYRFQHILIQRYLYHTLDNVERTYLNEAIGDALEMMHQGQTEAVAGQLAHHYQAAGYPQKAIVYLTQAGIRASQLSAHYEAIAHLERAQDLLDRLPDSPTRARLELDLLTALGTPLIATRSFAAPEVGKVYQRAWELGQHIGNEAQQFKILWHLWVFHNSTGDWQTARERAEQLLALAQQSGQSGHLLQAHHALWTNSYYGGDFAAVRQHAEQGAALYHPQQHRHHASTYGGHDPGVCARSFAALALWHLGYPNQARQRSQAGIDLARARNHPHSLVNVLTHAARLHQFCGDVAAVKMLAYEVMQLAESGGFAGWAAYATALLGWARIEEGEATAGIAAVESSLKNMKATRQRLWRLNILALLANAYAGAGRLEAGLLLLDEALMVVAASEAGQIEAELHRLRGKLQLAAGNTQAEESFATALAIARRQQAKSLELRAVTCLSRLWQQQGQRDRARALLGDCYHWFSEGFDTADLRAARALLEEMETQPAHSGD